MRNNEVVDKSDEQLPKVLADWNKLDDAGRVILSAKRGPLHERFDYARLAGRRVLLVDPPEAVEAVIERDEQGRWVGVAEWGTQGELHPRKTAGVAKFGADYDERPFPGIWINPARMHGAAGLEGTGIPVRRILRQLSRRQTVAALAAMYELDEVQVRAAIAYAAWLIGGQDPDEVAQWREQLERKGE